MKKLILACLFSTLTFSAAMKATCATPRNNVVIQIDGNKLSLQGRFPAQTTAQRTKVVGNSMTKIFFVAGEKHTLHFEDRTNFDEFGDFINIKTRKGHEITFPLNCKSVK